MNNTYAIILAGGRGTRISSELPKQFLHLAGTPIIIRAIEKFSAIAEVNSLIVVVPHEYISHTEDIIRKFNVQRVEKIITGGKTRQGSSYNAVSCKDFRDDDILIFHDSARPFVDTSVILKSIEETSLHGACGVYVRSTDTIAEVVNEHVHSIPDRERMFNTQTPQSFKYGIIKDAHEQAMSRNMRNATDDVSLAIDAGCRVRAIEGDDMNIKITTQFDLKLAELIISL